VNIFKVATRKDKMEGAAVLIISYDYVLRNILTRILSAKGHRVVNRSIGFHGIRTFQKSKGKFDIVVIDSDLPDMSGLGVAKKIKEVNRTTPTMLLRGWEKGAEERGLRDEGVDIAVRKPLFIDKTYELIENAVASAEKFNAK
jgi:two-component system aerobic respiration control sensor histidine kinase ArcB